MLLKKLGSVNTPEQRVITAAQADYKKLPRILPMVAISLGLSACTPYQAPQSLQPNKESNDSPSYYSALSGNQRRSDNLKEARADSVELNIDIYAEEELVLLHTPYPDQEPVTLAAYDSSAVFVGDTSTVSHIIELADANLVAGEFSQAMASYHKALEDSRCTNWEQSYIQGQIAIIYLSNSPLRDVRKAQERVKELSRALGLRGEDVAPSELTILYAVENRLRLELEKLQLLRKLRQRKEAFISLQEEKSLLQNALEKLRKLTLE